MTTPLVDMADLRWTVGERLRKAREHTGLDRAAFAAEIGISRNSVAKYESAETPPRSIVLRAWAFRTGFPVVWLETGAAPSAPDGGPAVSRCRPTRSANLSSVSVISPPAWSLRHAS